MGEATNGGERRTVLLVEDSAGDRALIRRLLRDANREYTVVESATGQAGLDRCLTDRPDCVLLDFYLPDMTGRDFLDALAQHAAPPPVVVLTGEEDDAVATDALKRGAQDYLAKDGVSARGLARAVENAIEKLQIRRALDEQRAAMAAQNRRLEHLRDELQARLVELADATKAKDRFLAVMSHEMRTPLNAILGYADLLDMQLEGDLSSGQRHYVDRMRVVSGHLLGLINDVLDLTRADARRLELDLRPVDLGAVIEEVVALLEGRAMEKQVALVVESCDGPLPHVHADLQRLRQVLTNLVGNALKFTDEGEVRVRCGGVRADGTVEIQVIDTGIGIAPDVLPLVFNEFYQAHGELTRRHGGSGLGLAISQRLTELMGGALDASSEVGKGSTFTIRLRAAPDGELRPDDVAHFRQYSAQHEAQRAERAASQSVAVVAYGEDRDALAQLAQRVSPGVRVRWTTEADSVADLVRAEHAALVVLEVGSAGGAAWRAALALQGEPEVAQTAVLLLPSLSAAMPEEGSPVLDLGWVSLVPKPFTSRQLTEAVSSAVRLGEGGARDGLAPDVIVVDDDPDSRRVAARFLEDASLTVREAPDGESALQAMRAKAPDVVVLDLMMPVLDGFGVLAAMRADPLLSGVPAVVLTAKSLTEAERQYLSRTAVRVLQKGEHRLADVAALVLRAAARSRQATPSP